MSIKSAILFLALCLAVARAQIELATYVDPNDIANNMQNGCKICTNSFIQPVLGDDNNVTPYVYTVCLDDGRVTFSANVGKSNLLLTQRYILFFETFFCDTLQFFALDRSKETKASRFYWDCKQGFMYMCKDYQVFDEETGRCVKGGKLLNELVPNNAPAILCPLDPNPQPQIYLPVSSSMCESLVSKAIPSVCSKCSRPVVQSVTSSQSELSGAQYTYCADNGYFSFDMVRDDEPHTFFIPSCKDNLVQPLDPSGLTTLSVLYWDCRYGLLFCPPPYVFDPFRNKCTPIDVVQYSNLYTGLENCPKTCGAITVSLSPYNSSAPSSYKPTLFAPSPLNLAPNAAYGK